MSIIVEQIFHPVGHGTFHTGVARYPGDACALSWVYDCGSKRRTSLETAIQRLNKTSEFGEKSQIDLLVISHFDDDHINGVESLLAIWSVKWLVLPYTDLAPRLAQAAAGDEPCSPSTALFQLDPIQWLAVRGLSERIENLLFVEGGPSPDTPAKPRPQNDNPDRPRRYLSKENPESAEQQEREKPHGVDLDRLVTPLSSFGSAGGAAPRLALLHHSQPVQALGTSLEFMFYNSDQPDMCRTQADGVRVARRSNAPLALVEAEVLQLIQQFRLGQPGSTPPRQWRKKLRDTYDKHFGKSSQARNNISLCLMTRVQSPLCQPSCSICSTGTASLCLGDLSVTSSTIDSMQRHFAHRWDALAVVQVPHHGSHHSWSSGNAARFDPCLFVQCVPNTSPHHPHPAVQSDIRHYSVMQANYLRGVRIWMRGARRFDYGLSR